MKEDYDYILVSTEFPHWEFDAYQFRIFMDLALLCDRRYKVDASSFRRRYYTKRHKRALEELIERGIFKADEQYLEMADDYKIYIRFAPEELPDIA